MRAKEFLAADEQVAFMKFVLDATWEQIKKKREDELKRQEGKKKAATASKRASIAKRNRVASSTQYDTSVGATGRPQHGS